MKRKHMKEGRMVTETTIQGKQATTRAISSAARWLQRRAGRRAKPATKRAYREASMKIRNLLRKR